MPSQQQGGLAYKAGLTPPRPRKPYDQRLRDLVDHLREDNACLRQEIDLLKKENHELRAASTDSA